MTRLTIVSKYAVVLLSCLIDSCLSFVKVIKGANLYNFILALYSGSPIFVFLVPHNTFNSASVCFWDFRVPTVLSRSAFPEVFYRIIRPISIYMVDFFREVPVMKEEYKPVLKEKYVVYSDDPSVIRSTAGGFTHVDGGV